MSDTSGTTDERPKSKEVGALRGLWPCLWPYRGRVLLAGLALARVHTLAAILAPVALFLFATGLNLPCAMAGAIGPFPRLAGTASALMGFMQMASGAAVGVVVGRMHDGTPLPTALAMAAMTIVLALVYGLVVPRAASAAR